MAVGSAGRLAGVAMVAAVGLLALIAGPAVALPPPPANPSNSTIDAAQTQADARARQVGQLAGQLSSAQAALANLQDAVELKQENANKALVDLRHAQDTATAAQHAATEAQVDATAAGNAVDQLRTQVDQFAAGSFEQGAELGSVAAYFGATSPKDLLARQELLDDISGSELNILAQMQQARVQQANADSLARAALSAARARQAAAETAKRAADEAIVVAQTAEDSEAAQTARLQADQATLQQQLAAAQATVADLKSARQQYQDWLARKQAADAAAAAAALRAGGAHVSLQSAHATGSVAAVLRRALSAVGVIYAWGGGDADGPTRGVHDGGVADSYGDYDRIGFDCSGLMVYAFAGAGVDLPHYSGYQYTAGRHVPLSQIQPGDLLFYSSDGTADGIHHVTLYVGGGQMVEAYESGTTVRVTSVRYYGGIMPYATRLL